MTKFQAFKFRCKRFWKALCRPIWLAAHVNKLTARKVFTHAHQFKDNDPEVAGLKWGILYGRLYFEKSPYKTNGEYDRHARSVQVDAILKEYYEPADREQYLKKLKALRDGVITANKCGFFSVGNDPKQNAIEAAHYQAAMDSLEILIANTIAYPSMWNEIFLQPCEHVH